MTDSKKGDETLLPEERKALARLAHEAINQRKATLNNAPEKPVG